MNRLKFKIFVVIALALLVSAACSPNTVTSINTPATPVATSAAVSAAPNPQVTMSVSEAQNALDACTLVTKDEATQAIGLQLKDGLKNAKAYSAAAQGLALGTATLSTCTYVGQASSSKYVNVLVFQFGANGDAMVQEFKAKMSQNPQIAVIPGLGDVAYGLPATVLVFKGNVAVGITVVASATDAASSKFDKAQSLAAAAVKRLP